MATINTNIKALFSQSALKSTDRSLTVAMQELSTGKRINSARDDAAGMSIVTRMTEQIRGLNQAVRNANDAINLIQTAEGATNEITDMMQRMRELAVQAVNDTNSNQDRSYLDLEFQQLKQQIVQISDDTQWNGFSVLNGTAGQQVGEIPLFKVTSDNEFGSVFIQPTTSKTVSGADAGEVQQFNLAGSVTSLSNSAVSPGQGFSVAGVNVDMTDSENTLSKAADKIATVLANDPTYANKGITVSHTVPSVVVTDGDGTTAESAVVSFKDMKAGQTVTVAGKTFTAKTDVTGAAVAGYFSGTTLSATVGAFTGSLTGYTAAGSASGTSLTFTSTDSGKANVADIAVSGSVTLNYSAASGDVPAAVISAGSSGLQVTTANGDPTKADTTRYAVTSAVENIANSGKFLQSGAIQLSVAKGAMAGDPVTATFTNSDSKQIVLTGKLSSTSPATVTFAANDGLNSQVMSDDITYTLQESTPSGLADANLSTTPRAVSMTVGVQGSIPSLRDGDLLINGVNVGPSTADDDLVSPRNNAAGSAIAKAAAINRVAVDQGVSQGEIQAVTFSGTPNPGTITVGGVSVTLTADDSTPALVATKVAAALKASSQFDATATSRSISYAPGSDTISISYPFSDGNVKKVPVDTGTTGLGSIVNTTQQYTVKQAGTGVFAKVNENVLSGQAMMDGKVETGVVFINGYASADITTVYNNSQATRANVVRAINLISDKTGVKAIDTGSDQKGVQLVAADGRNIEVRFEPSGSSTPSTFGDRIGMREGVQSSTISLESKIETPVVIGTSASGDVSRSGLVAGTYAKNQSVLNTKDRDPVDSSVAQVSSVKLSGTAGTSDSVTVVVNGKQFTASKATTTTNVTAANVATPQGMSQKLVDLINSDSTLGVYASLGSTTGELQLTARTPGVAFTMTASNSNSASGAVAVTASSIVPNHLADVKSLGSNDLTINGIAIPPAKASDDKYSYTGVSSSDAASSAIALSAAINASSTLTGVKATPNPAQIAGTTTTTDTPDGISMQSLYVNGVKIDVKFEANEDGSARRAKVVAAINERTGEHGVMAVDNGKGVTLTTPDGRNMSVWFDSSVKNLSASDFGLDQGGSIAQVSKVNVAGSGAIGDQLSVVINGVKVTSAALASGAVAATDSATALSNAINLAVSNGTITNVHASVDGNGNVLINSTVPGTAFDLRSPTVAGGATQTLTMSTVTANSQGNNNVSAVNLSGSYAVGVLGYPAGTTSAPPSALNIKTVYGTVKMVSDAAMLPTMPNADGITPSSLNSSGNPILIGAGTDGFGDMSNFSALGFNEGSFGGRASEDMDPPRVGRLAFQVGADANQVVTIDLADFGKKGNLTGAITGDVDLNVDARSVRINTREGATAVLSLLDTAMDKINATRATMGAVMNRLDHVVNNLTNVSTNMSASRSSIQDADYAQASTDLAKSQIMQQAATAVLAQANTSQQSVLKLLGN